MLTRALAIIPAIIIIAIHGNGGVTELLTLSQVALALQLPLAMIPLLYFTSRERYMGKHRNGWFLLVCGLELVLVDHCDGSPGSTRIAASHIPRHHRQVNRCTIRSF